MTVADVDRMMCCPFCRNRKLERGDDEIRRRERRHWHRHERVYVDRAIVVVSFDMRAFRLRRVMRRCMAMARQVRVNRVRAVVLRRVIVRVRMDERRGQTRGLNGQRHGDGDHLAHGIIVYRRMAAGTSPALQEGNMRKAIVVLSMVGGTVVGAQQQPASPNPRQQPGATVHIFAPEQHDLYDGHFVMSANRIYMIGGVNDPEGWDHLDNEARTSSR